MVFDDEPEEPNVEDETAAEQTPVGDEVKAAETKGKRADWRGTIKNWLNRNNKR